MNKKLIAVVSITFLLAILLYGLVDVHFFYILQWDFDTVVNFLHTWLTILTSYFAYNFLLLKAFKKLNLRRNLDWILLLFTISIAIFLYVLSVDLLFYKFYYDISSLKEETTFFEYDLPIMATMLLVGSAFFYQKYYNRPISKKTNTQDISNKGIEKLKLQVGNETLLINHLEVGVIYTDQGMVWLQLLNGKNFHTNFILSKLLEELNENNFFRLNRQVIISRRGIVGFTKLDYQKLKVELSSQISYDKNLIVSKYNAPEFKKWIALSN